MYNNGAAPSAPIRQIMRLTVWSVMSQVIRRISRLLKAATAASTIAVLAVGTSLTIGQLHPFVAGATGFVNDYPDMAAVDCSGQFGSWSWCENENSDTDPPYESSEQNSSRLYGYRNCTDGVAYWIQGYTGVTVPTNLGNGQTWDNNAPSTYSVIAGTTTTNIEPGDIAQSDDGSVGHVGFVTSVTQNSDGTVASFTTAELNQAGTGEYNGGTSTYATRDAAGKFQRQANPLRDWDSFIDVNGAGKGLNNETWPAPAHSKNLTFIKTANTGSSNVQIHWASQSANFGQWSGGYSTWFSLADAANGVWTNYDMNSDGKNDLVFIKTANTSGQVEVHWLDAATNFAGPPHSYATWFSLASVPYGSFSIANIDGYPDLVYIATANTGSGKVEIHWASSTNNYSTWAGGWATWFTLANVPYGSFSIANLDGYPDLVFLATNSTGSGKVEIHWSSFVNGYSTWAGGYASWFSLSLVPNGKFLVANLDSHPDLVYIMTANTGTSNVQIHWASSVNNYGTWTNGYNTWFTLADAGNGKFSVGQE